MNRGQRRILHEKQRRKEFQRLLERLGRRVDEIHNQTVFSILAQTAPAPFPYLFGVDMNIKGVRNNPGFSGAWTINKAKEGET